MNAIETTYAGFRFRSRIEARWAVFFDQLQVPYRYEPEGFELGDGVRYLPDFWLPHLGAWFEVKGAPYTNSEGEKMAKLVVATKSPGYIAWGDCWLQDGWGSHDTGSVGIDLWDPREDEGGLLVAAWDNGQMWCECGHCGALGIEFTGFSNRLPCHRDLNNRVLGSDTPRLIAAYTAARSARFGT